MNIKRVKKDSMSLEEFLEDNDLTVVVTCFDTVGGGCSYSATLETSKGKKLQFYYAGDTSKRLIVFRGTERSVLDELRHTISSRLLHVKGWFGRTIQVPILNSLGGGDED